jgi:CheY-like chemotaxis protein
MKYLVIDDSKLARLNLIKSLKNYIEEAEIFQATNGLEAIEIMQMFLDLTMPIMDGYEALPKLLEINPKANVVVVSADIQEKAKDKVINLGAQLHVQKPININKMKDILDML